MNLSPQFFIYQMNEDYDVTEFIFYIFFCEKGIQSKNYQMNRKYESVLLIIPKETTKLLL